MTAERARWCQSLAQAMVEADLSVDAAARLWGLERAKVLHLLRSDTVRRPAHVVQWVDNQSRRSGQQKPPSKQLGVDDMHVIERKRS